MTERICTNGHVIDADKELCSRCGAPAPTVNQTVLPPVVAPNPPAMTMSGFGGTAAVKTKAVIKPVVKKPVTKKPVVKKGKK